MSIPSSQNVAERHRDASEFLADGSTEETVLVKDPDFGDIAGIVTQDDRLAHIGG